MSQSDRNRRHQARLAQVNALQVVCGCGDHSRIDHEATLLERARQMGAEISAHAATERGLAALDRLLRIVEEHGPARAQDVCVFIDAVWNRKPLPLDLLRQLDDPAGDDVVAVLDAYRHARVDLLAHVRGGPRRVARAMTRASAGIADL